MQELTHHKPEILIFECDILDINSKEYWIEIIQVAFVKGDNYISISRLSYEDEIYMEYNDQINYLYSNCKDVKFKLKENILSIQISNSKKRFNMPCEIQIILNTDCSNLNEVFEMLQSPPKDL
ncbi:hypothetical protein [Bacteroides congonensis]|uniref:hypothetical protein n=1 Tax=Bacteroides congonensis TaxID=1871006 RepID=UPI003A8A811A